MSRWRRWLRNFAEEGEDDIGGLRARLAARLGLADPLQIQPYAGFGNPTRFYLKARVLQDEGIRAAEDDDSLWDNILGVYRRLESDEIPGATVEVTVGENTVTAVSDNEGFVEVTMKPDNPLPAKRRWHAVRWRLIDAPVSFNGDVTAVGRLLLPPANADFGIISDIDDTVLQSNATNYLSAARLLFLNNARTRLPFDGVAAFYRALQSGPGEKGHNPIFYVSSSPWNLYTLLTEFFEVNGLPPGPLLLRDYGLSAELFSGGHHEHKMQQIARIIDTYPRLSFVLIGDSGQEDPEIYAEVVRRYPQRIQAIYIRDVTPGARGAEVQKLAQEVQEAGSALLLSATTAEAAQHAAEMGLIAGHALTAVAGDVQAAQSLPTVSERLLDET